MMRRIVTLVVLTAVTVLLCGSGTGCGDDVKKVQTHEQTQEGPVETVSPGEPIVE